MNQITRFHDPETGVLTTGSWQRDEAIQRSADNLFMDAIGPRLELFVLAQEFLAKARAIRVPAIGLSLCGYGIDDLCAAFEDITTLRPAEVDALPPQQVRLRQAAGLNVRTVWDIEAATSADADDQWEGE